MAKKLTKNQKLYQAILVEAEQQGISTQGLKSFPKKISQKALQDLQTEISQRQSTETYTVTDSIISRLQALPSKKQTYTHGGEAIDYNLENFYYTVLGIMKQMQEEFGIEQYEYYLQQNEAEIITAIDSINESLYSEVVQAKTEDLIPLLSNHDMSRISAIQTNDINEYFGFTDLDNI
jgi:hypothetical protein